MAALLLPIMLPCMLLPFGATPGQLPPRQTALQARLHGMHAANAARASPLATPAVLKALGAPAFRSALQECCPAVAGMSPLALLAEWRAQMEVIEVIHNFHPTVDESGGDHRPNSADVTLSMLLDARYLYNMWELGPLNLTNPIYMEGWIGMSAKMETGLLRYPDFGVPDAPSGRPFPCECVAASLRCFTAVRFPPNARHCDGPQMADGPRTGRRLRSVRRTQRQTNGCPMLAGPGMAPWGWCSEKEPRK